MQLEYNQSIVLENSRVRLEPLSPIHVPGLNLIVLAQPHILQYSPPAFGTPELLGKYVANNINLRGMGEKYMWAIIDKDKNAVAGCTSYLNISSFNAKLEIGSTWIGRQFQRTGLNRHCKFLLLSYAFEQLGAQRVQLKTDNRNEQSKTAIQAIGAQYEGLLRSDTLMSDGYRRSTAYYSILQSEWPSIKSTIFAGYS